MKIAILGAGNIGGTLGRKWLAAGHEVIFGVRDSHSAKTSAALEKAGGKIRAVDMAEALRFGQVVLVSIPYGAVPELLAIYAAEMANKTILDATNNFAGPVINNLERIRGKVPSAVLYRAFNSLGWELFAEPQVGGQQADMFYSGPDGPQRTLVDGLIAEIGVRPIWVGDNDQAAIVDDLGALWVTLVRQRGRSRRIALKLIE
jgi:8-hydroxy-5-deazaflavin:NADPH oxidoreductase